MVDRMQRVREVIEERFEGERDGSSGLVPTIGEGFSPPRRLIDESEFHWFHPPLQGSSYLCVLSREPLWYAGHYVQGRMRLCRGDQCEACRLGIGRQIRYVLCCVDLSTRQIGVLEVGSGPGEVLRHHCEIGGGLRGTVLALGRASRKKNSRLVVEIVREVAPSWTTDLACLDIQGALFSTWSRAEAQSPPKAHNSEEG